jgi:hypothetical protein
MKKKKKRKVHQSLIGGLIESIPLWSKLPLQPDAQVQPTLAPINTDKATRLSTVHNHFQLGHSTTLT